MRKFYIGLDDKLLVIRKKDNKYIFSTCLHDKKINRLAFDPQNENRIYAATNNEGLWRTEDDGENWERIGITTGLTSPKITAVATSPIKRINGKSIVYAGTEPSALYYSKDNGESWIEFTGIQKLPSKKYWQFPPRPETHFVRWITPSYTDENHLALSIEAGAVLHTDDHGLTWYDRPQKSPIDVHTLLAHPKKPGSLYSANGDGSSESKRAYAESHDGGLNWEYKSRGLEEHPYLYNMVLNSTNPKERLVSASKSASAAHRTPRYSTVYRKIDDSPWSELATGLPRTGAYTHHLAEDPLVSGAYYALNNYGLYYLPAGEDRWEKLPVDVEEKGFNQRAYYFVVKVNKNECF